MKESLICIRHGRSEHNVGVTKDLDSPLTKFGIEQAKVVGRFWATQYRKAVEPFCWIQDYGLFTSPFLRCLQTSKHIIEAFYEETDIALEVRVEPRLSESLYPSNPRVVVPFREAEFPRGKFHAVNKDLPGFDWFGVGFRNQHILKVARDHELYFDPETNEQYLARLHEIYDDLPQKSVVISHGLPVATLAMEAERRLNGMPLWDYSINNCSLTWIKNGRRKWWARNLHHEHSYHDQPH